MQYFSNLIIFVIVIVVVLWGISIYFVKTGRLSARDWSMKSLGLPQGSVRALLALIILFSLIYYTLTGVTLPDIPDWMVGILGTIIGFYFGAAMVPKASSEEKTPNPR